MVKKTSPKQNSNPFTKKQVEKIIKNKVIKIQIRNDCFVFFDEWYLEELVDILNYFKNEKYLYAIDAIRNKKYKKPTNFPQFDIASHRVAKKSSFYEYETMQSYLENTWFCEDKQTSLRVNINKKFTVKLSHTGSIVHVPSYINNLSLKHMLSFSKNKSKAYQNATILLNLSAKVHWKDYKKMMQDFFEAYIFDQLVMANIAKTVENNITYYRISTIKIRKNSNVTRQGLMLESADLMRRLFFVIYEINPTELFWKNYGNVVSSSELEEIKQSTPYFSAILAKYLNPFMIVFE